MTEAGRVIEVRNVQVAIRDEDWGGLKWLLHPYLHWTDASRKTLRGRRRVLARLAETRPTGPPSSCELRDGQIHRWTEAEG